MALTLNSPRSPGRPRLALPADEVVRLYEVERWTYGEIADAFGVCVATARNHYRHARPGVPARPRGTRSRRETFPGNEGK